MEKEEKYSKDTNTKIKQDIKQDTVSEKGDFFSSIKKKLKMKKKKEEPEVSKTSRVMFHDIPEKLDFPLNKTVDTSNGSKDEKKKKVKKKRF